MPLNANTYGTVQRVQDMIGDMLPNRTFTSDTTPSLSAVETALNDTANYLNMELEQHGYITPVEHEATRGFLAWANSAGAASEVLGQTPFDSSAAGLTPDSEEIQNSRRNYFLSIYRTAVKRIQEEEIPAPKNLPYPWVTSGSKDTKPFFDRNMFEVPPGYLYPDDDGREYP